MPSKWRRLNSHGSKTDKGANILIPTSTRSDRRRAERELRALIRARLEEQIPHERKTFMRRETIDLMTRIQQETMFRTMEIAMEAVRETSGIGEKRADAVYSRIYEKLNG